MLITIARPAATVVTVLGLLALSACGDDEPERDRTSTIDDVEDAKRDLADAQEDSGVPKDCDAAFPLAWGAPDLADAALPEGWPEPPEDAVLCAVSDPDAGSVQTVDYATDQDAAAVLDHYERTLADVEGYDVSREEPPGLGHEVILGSAGDGGFQVDPRDGGFRIAYDLP